MTRVDVRHLELLIAVSEERNFTRAAARLHMSQSALSQIVRRIERELGFDVFDRSRAPLATTVAGRLFLPHARVIATTFARAVAEARQGEEDSVLTVGAAPTLARELFPVLLTLFEEVGAEPPRMVETASSEMNMLLRRGLIDLGVMSTGAAGASMEFLFTPVASSEIVAVSALQGRGAGDDSLLLEPQHLAGHPLLLPKPGGVRSHLTPFLAALGEPNVVFESSGMDSLVGMAASGAGVALVPQMVLTAAMRRRFPGLCVRRLEHGPPAVWVGINELVDHPSVRRLAELKAHLREALLIAYPADTAAVAPEHGPGPRGAEGERGSP